MSQPFEGKSTDSGGRATIMAQILRLVRRLDDRPWIGSNDRGRVTCVGRCIVLVSPRKVLWPTDFSSLSLQGGLYAQGFRDVFGAELHVIHVIPPPLNPDVSVMLPGAVPVNVTEPE